MKVLSLLVRITAIGSINNFFTGVFMKTAVVFYSLSGNCSYIAAHLQERLETDCFELKLRDGKKRKGFFSMLWGGFMVVSGKLPALWPINFDPSRYDLIILGAPVWAGSLAPPMKSFLNSTRITGKKIALFTCYAGDAGKSFEEFEAFLPGSKITGRTGFKNPKNIKPDEVKLLINDWVKEIV